MKLQLRLVVLALALAPIPAAAAESNDGSLDYSVASWDRNSGLPSGGITALMAAADGSLWVGMDTGLYRFDGLRFVRAGGTQAQVTHLKSAADGSVWVVLAGGNVARIKNGQTTQFGTAEGLPGIAATALVEDAQRRLWLGTRRGLYLLQGDRWVRSTPKGLPEALRLSGVTVDRAGNMLLSANDTLYRRDNGQDAFTPVASIDTPGSANNICATTSGQVYITDPTRGFTVVGPTGGPLSPSRSVGRRLLCDKRDNVWVATGGGGLWRIPPTTGTEPPKVITGMLGELANSLAEDDRGNIWVGRPAGLTRLSPNPMVRLADLGVSTAIESTGDGHLWVGTLDGLVELIPESRGVREYRRYLPSVGIRALHADSAGAIWIASERGLSRLTLATRTIDDIPTGSTKLRQVDSLSSGLDGTVWIADGERGVLRWRASRLEPLTLPAEIRDNPVNVLHVDRTGRTWLALERGAAVVHPDGRIDVMSDAGVGRDARRSRSILEDSRGVIWIGGIGSLVRVSGGTHRVFTESNGFPVDFVKGLGEDVNGDIWVAADAVIVRIARSEFDRVGANAGPSDVRYEAYDTVDGAGVPRLLGDRSVTQAPDGVLWFITGNGITGIDPRLPSFNDSTIPTASIVSALADGNPVDALRDTRFSSSTRAVQIDYTALNINSPHRTRFRYRLRGFDDQWQEAGARMTAFYTNLPPGDYAFEVAASNAINTWGEPTGSWHFSVEPAFYQTAWFPLLCTGLVALAGWGVWRFRLAQVRKQFGIVLGERVRLSREIHDTLLQSLVGVAVQCEVLAKDVERSPGTARDTLIRLRRQVESHIREFRQAVSDLRAERDDFISAIRTAGETAERMSGVQFDLVVRGRPRPSPEEVERQLIKIAREAVSNAARHARARSISVEVGYDDASLRLRVKDDGRGFDPEDSTRVAEGHCGLISMKERASEIGARLSISSTFGQGTQVEAVVPLSPA